MVKRDDSPQDYINRELSWLAFARRVLALAEDARQPLLERVKFAGIMGIIYDEFAMKRIGGLRRKIENQEPEAGPDGMTPIEELRACRAELAAQARRVDQLPFISNLGLNLAVLINDPGRLRHRFVRLKVLRPIGPAGCPYPLTPALSPWSKSSP